MNWQISLKIDEILKKGSDFGGIEKDEAIALMHLDLNSRETYALMQTANWMTWEQFGPKGENHFHIGLNVAPCPFNCSFCSLTQSAGIFQQDIEFPMDEVLQWARMAEEDHADALNIMTTGTYSFQKLLDAGRLLKKAVSVPLVANTRDITHREGEKLLEAGFVGAYHAVRLGEGKDTPFSVEKRIQTLQVFRDLGLLWMNCVEPVGPEHKTEEIVDLMFLARKYGAVYSGVMRRVNFPGSPMEKYGMITEREMARMVAVSRLVMGDIPKAHCTHEPNTASLMAGANLFFPEKGANPRDGAAQVKGGRGRSISSTHQIHREVGMDPLLPSNCFSGHVHTHNPL